MFNYIKYLNIMLVFMGLAFFPLPLCAITITLTDGTWSETINESDLSTASTAGSDLTGAYTHDFTASIADLNSVLPENYGVTVKKTDSSWNSNFILYIARTGDGTDASACGLYASISGDENTYLEITETSQELFTGWCRRNNIPLRYKLEGVSVSVPPGTYSTTVIFTATTPY